MLSRFISSRPVLSRAAASQFPVVASIRPPPASTSSRTLPARFLSAPPPSNDAYAAPAEETDPNRLSIIRGWMKWSRWKYVPDPSAISKIGASPSPLDQFRDTVSKEKRTAEPVGRSWSVGELRRKSYEDLHKLWYVLYKERNMLLTESNLSRRHGYPMVQPERRKKVRKSMGAIKHVLGERKRRKIAEHKLYLEELERFDGLMKEMNLSGDDGVDEEEEMEEAMLREGKEIKFERVE